MMKSFLLLCISLITISLFAQKEPQLSFDVEGKTLNLEGYLNHKNINGLSAYLLDANGEEYHIQVGKRDVEANLPVDRNTLFQAGSLTSALVHFAVLRLVNDGQIKLDAPANDYLKSWQINTKGFTKRNPVSVRDLLIHKRGFNKAYKPKGYKPGNAIPSLLQVLNGEPPSQESPVRLKKNINKSANSHMANVLVLQQLLEDVHGRPLSEIMQTEVFQALEMKNSFLRKELSSEEKKNASIGFEQDGRAIAGDRWIYPEEGHSGLWCSSEDYGRFAKHVIMAAAGKDNRFINQELGIASITPEHGRRSLIFLKWDILGWGGASKGFRTQFNGNVEEDWIAVIFMNSHENWYSMNEVQWKVGEFLGAKSKK